MAWVTPKTDWATTDGIATTDLNRIEENIRVLGAGFTDITSSCTIAINNGGTLGATSVRAFTGSELITLEIIAAITTASTGTRVTVSLPLSCAWATRYNSVPYPFPPALVYGSGGAVLGFAQFYSSTRSILLDRYNSSAFSDGDVVYLSLTYESA